MDDESMTWNGINSGSGVDTYPSPQSGAIPAYLTLELLITFRQLQWYYKPQPISSAFVPQCQLSRLLARSCTTDYIGKEADDETLKALPIARIGLELLDMGLPVHGLNARIETPSSNAAQYGLEESMVVFLIPKEADTVFEDRDYCTPLMRDAKDESLSAVGIIFPSRDIMSD